ncbi:AraC family transcriptional regulator [Neobacillus mesonae]|nr:AraC family transcriptional regulator [Neobacillus mesonae]
MDFLSGMNRAMEYIEERLLDELDYKQAARAAGCSEYHFKRMFSTLAGLPISEYIRRRRLTLAGLELMEGKSALRVIDIAVKYGYSSPDSFTRAFQSMHGMLPSEVHHAGKSLKAYPKMTFYLSIRGGEEMDYRIVKKEAFRIVGFYKRVPILFSGVNPEIASLWSQLNEQSIRELKALSNIDPAGLISASTHFSEGRMEEKGELDHYIGAATTLGAPSHYNVLEVPASTWAVFEAAGTFPDKLQEVWGRIYADWFPSSNYEIAPGPELLWNESKDTSLPNYRSEIWIPVVKK